MLALSSKCKDRTIVWKVQMTIKGNILINIKSNIQLNVIKSVQCNLKHATAFWKISMITFAETSFVIKRNPDVWK